jgi:hypothetical protein
MKENGKMIKDMGWVLKGLLMEIYMKVNIEMVKLKDLEDTLGLIKIITMDSGLLEINRVMAHGKEFRMNNIAVNGHKINLMALENICGIMEIFMKESGKHVLGMDKDAINLLSEIYMLENINMGKQKVMDNILGAMEMYI